MASSRYDEIMKTTPYLPLIMGGHLAEGMISKARKELGETEDVKAKTIPELRKLIQGVAGLFSPTDDAFLLQYLRAKKFNVQKTFSLLKNAYDVKRSYDHIYGSFDLEALRRAYGLKSVFALPYRDEEGCAVVVVRMHKWDVDVTTAPEAMTALTVTYLMCLHEPATQVCGVRLLVDVRGASLKQLGSLIPRYARLLTKGLQNCFPIRIKGLHLYNESTIFQYMWSVFKLFMTEKIKSRIHLHGDSQENLHKLIPKAILPAEDFGGDNPNDVADWYNAEVEKYFEIYRQITTYGYRK